MMKAIFYVTAGLTALALGACSQGDKQSSDIPQSKVETSENDKTNTTDKENAIESLRLYAFDCGRINMLDLGMFSSNGAYAGRQNEAADMCFLIRHPKGDLMWDAGLPDALNQQTDGVTNGPFHVSVPTTLASQLNGIGVTPSDVEFFSISHSHFDHVGNAAMFAGSIFLIDQDERDHMFRDEARADAQTFGLVAMLEEAETKTFDGDYDVFGDGSVKIIATPGHTPGHSSLLVNLANAGPMLLTGDLYHLLESREKRIVPIFNTDEEETLRSMDKFEALTEETGARVVIQHSLEHMAELPTVPSYLD